MLKNSLVTHFIGPFSYENLSGQGTFSTLSKNEMGRLQVLKVRLELVLDTRRESRW
jgi:hypothetical protein